MRQRVLAYTAAEVAREFGVSRQQVTNWCRNGRLPAIQPSGPRGMWLIPRDALRQWGDALVRMRPRKYFTPAPLLARRLNSTNSDLP